jgi:inosine/xanthosine triphosphatase
MDQESYKVMASKRDDALERQSNEDEEIVAAQIQVASAAVGSVNPVKREAAGRALRSLWPHVLVEAVEVDSGVAEQPRSAEEAIEGALARARSALALCGTEMAVGLEGNVEETPWGMVSTAWVAVLHADGRIGLGSSGRFLLPTRVAEAIRAGGELGPLMDALLGEENVKHKQGAVGAFTGGRINRVDALEQAVLLALSSFFAPQHYAA